MKKMLTICSALLFPSLAPAQESAQKPEAPVDQWARKTILLIGAHADDDAMSHGTLAMLFHRLFAYPEFGNDRIDADGADTLPVEQTVDGFQDIGAGNLFVLLRCHWIRACFFSCCSATSANLIDRRLAIKRFSGFRTGSLKKYPKTESFTWDVGRWTFFLLTQRG